MASDPDVRRKLRLVRRAMKRRCYDSSDPYFRIYGAKGVRMCRQWLDSPKAFVGWALSNGYRPGLYIDRIDPAKHYAPENCRWVTPKQSTRNRVNTLHLTYRGVRRSLGEWAERTGINYETLRRRYHKNTDPRHVLRSS